MLKVKYLEAFMWRVIAMILKFSCKHWNSAVPATQIGMRHVYAKEVGDVPLWMFFQLLRVHGL